MKYFKFFSLISLVFLALLQPVHAEDYDDSACYCEEQYILSGSVDVLYWKPCQDLFTLSTTVTASNTKKNHYLDRDWDTGYRLGFNAYFPCSEFLIDSHYTSYESKSEQSITFTLGTSGTTAFGTAALTDAPIRTIQTLNYKSFDFYLGLPIHLCSGVEVDNYFGFKALWLDQDFLQTFVRTSEDPDSDTVRTEFNAYGITAKIEPHYDLFCVHDMGDKGCLEWGLIFFTKAEGSLVIGRNTYLRTNMINPSFNRDVDREVNFACSLAAGISAEAGLCGTHVGFSTGYEVLYENSIGHPLLSPIGSSTHDHLTLHGFFLRASISF
jgi:hypothetical protein